MMNFNIDFVTHNLTRKRAPSSRTFQSHARTLAESLERILKSNKTKLKQAWIRLTAVQKPRVSQLEIIQRMIDHRLKSVFYELLHFTFVSKKEKLTSERKHDYPLATLARIISQIHRKMKDHTFSLLKKNKRVSQDRQNQLINMFDIFKHYVKRNVTRRFFRGFTSFSVKASEYADHLWGFEYLFETMRVKKLFQAFACLSIKTITKNVGDLEKQKASKRQQARLSFMKRSQVLNDLKRKVTNVIGQVNEGQINNNRKRVNGSRENGMKLTKMNEDTRLLEINTDDVEWKVAKLQEQIKRKEQYIQNRSSNEISLDFLKQLYKYISTVDTNQVTSDEVFNKISKGVSLQSLYQSLNFQIMTNIKLKHEMNLFEKIGQPRKNENYINCQNQNSTLKDLISSLMKTQFLTQTVAEMSSLAEQLKQEVKLFQNQRSVVVQRAK